MLVREASGSTPNSKKITFKNTKETFLSMCKLLKHILHQRRFKRVQQAFENVISQQGTVN